MAYAAALAIGLVLLWLGWAAAPLAAVGWAAGAIAVSFAFIAALSMRIVDREGAPYWRAPLFIVVALGALRDLIRTTMDVIKRAFAADPGLHPALVQFRTQTGAETGRANFANTAALALGAIAVETQEDSLLIHVLIEDDADDHEMRALEANVRRAAP